MKIKPYLCSGIQNISKNTNNMKTLFINGSPNKDGNTVHLAQAKELAQKL